ncbi:ComEC/Rec2 family competence protein [Sphingomicrobium flavum]|uniref:ComEC/Rec2 family competence protein n=1 Tax=Sphingomicrobium flavum TaxID=1229164 RepID=UPI0021AE19FA|nr:ComEC/Rec2 family competence protein [Sphingomicrobium flavum]
MVSAPNMDAAAPLLDEAPNFNSPWRRLGRQTDAVLEAERAQLPLWAVVAFGSGIASWFALDGRDNWTFFLICAAALAMGGLALGGRLGRAMVWGGLLASLGMALIWLRAEWVEAPRITRPTIANFEAEVLRVEPLVAKEKVRLTLKPANDTLPPKLRVTLRDAQWTNAMGEGARLSLRARLVGPPEMALPGTYDFARKAWFEGIGGVGTALGEVKVFAPATSDGRLDRLRASIGQHVRNSMPGSGDGIATALTTGDKNAVADADAEAMRRSGLAHLLAVSGLHIAAVVGAAMLLFLKVAALSEKLARRHNLILWSAAAGAIAGIVYTLLTGMQVPTVRACIAALLVLGGLALGRDALSLRLVAVGALLILFVRPEAIAGASFQLSFAAVTAIIALHDHPRVKGWLSPRDEGRLGRFGRGMLALLLTGLAVEVTLMPFALYHFHKAGLYGVIANLVAIPMTTFIIMPLLALALLFDLVGLGAPFWWLAGLSLDFLLGLAHLFGIAKGSVAMVPTMPTWAFALATYGGLWVLLWRKRWRWWGLVPVLIGMAVAFTAPRPDLLVTGDGRHLAVVSEEGEPLLLRERSGDFIRDMLSEASGYDGQGGALADQRFANCNRDACLATIERGGRQWRLLAIRSRDYILWEELTAACANADIVVAERWLPRACTPRWLKLDRKSLEESGGLAIHLANPPKIFSVRDRVGDHPWTAAARRKDQ